MWMHLLLTEDLPSNLGSPWAAYGGVASCLGMALTAFLRGWVVTGRTLDEMRQRAERAEQESKQQAEFLRDSAMPVLTRTQDLLVKMIEERSWDERNRRNPPS